MIYGYARVSTDGQSVAAQVAGLWAAGAGKVFREVASGAKTDRAQLRVGASRAGIGGETAGNSRRIAGVFLGCAKAAARNPWWRLFYRSHRSGLA